jgi:hypothetical protein
MTKVWGPLGWMTLEGIALAYPISPTREDKLILKKYLDDFTEVIPCPSCKGHFSAMFKRYTTIHPDWADSRSNFFTFISRAHNTVNKRLDKPRYATAKECLDTLQYATKNTSFIEYRKQYMNYLKRNYSKELSGDGMIALNHIREMQKINDSYWAGRQVAIESVAQPLTESLEGVDMLEIIPEDTVFKNIAPIIPSGGIVGFKLRGGKFTLGSRK